MANNFYQKDHLNFALVVYRLLLALEAAREGKKREAKLGSRRPDYDPHGADAVAADPPVSWTAYKAIGMALEDLLSILLDCPRPDSSPATEHGRVEMAIQSSMPVPGQTTTRMV